MPQLRWTLLLLGVLFVILLWWLERRSQRRKFIDRGPVDRGSAEKERTAESMVSAAPVFREPSLTLPEMRAREPSAPQDLPVVEIEEDSLNARRIEVGEPLMDPPTLSLPVLESGPARRERVEPTVSGADWIKPRSEPTMKDFDVPRLDTPASQRHRSRVELEDTPRRGVNKIELADAVPQRQDNEEQAFNEAVFGETSREPGEATTPDYQDPVFVGASRPAADPASAGASEPAGDEPLFADEPPPAPRFTAADVTPITDPIVEWPPDEQRRVVALRLVAPPPERLAGRALRLALASEGFVLGKFHIFHKPDDSGRAVLSAANLSKPGTFDVETMDLQRFGGLSLFTVLPGPKPPLKAFEELLATARNLNERLQGALQDERGGPLTPTRIATLRESLSSTEAAS